jgi:hypothetical protein
LFLQPQRRPPPPARAPPPERAAPLDRAAELLPIDERLDWPRSMLARDAPESLAPENALFEPPWPELFDAPPP